MVVFELIGARNKDTKKLSTKNYLFKSQKKYK